MKKVINKIQSVLTCIVLVTCALLLTAVSASAYRFNYPGVQCQAYNNNQANALERSHVRLLNPATNNQSVWVVCGLDRDPQYATSTINASYGWYNVYFGAGVTDSVTCIFREFDRDSIHVPGGDLDATNTINALATTIDPPATLPGVPTTGFTLTNDGGVAHYAMLYTVTCLLPPGTGMQMINLEEQ